MSKEITKTFISFKSKHQMPLIMIYRLYYKTKKDRRKNKEYWGEVLFDSYHIEEGVKRCLKK